MNEIFALSNSPGEVSGWLGPVAEAIRASEAGVSITAVTLPCPYASGMEARCAGGLPGVTRSMTLRAALAECAALRRAPGRRLILQLGGDPMYGFALSFRMHAPWMIYTSRPKFPRHVAHYFLQDEKACARFDKAGVPASKRTVAGSLILDSVPRVSGAIPGFSFEGKKLITFMSGSRPFEYELGCGFFCECARRLHSSFPDWQAIMPVAPTVDEDVLRRGLAKAGFDWNEEEHEGQSRVVSVRISDGYDAPFIRTGQYEAIAASSLAVAPPGTNNLQIALLGVPLIMVAPLNEAQHIPLDGLAGAVPHKSRLMRGIKKRLVLWANAREKYISLPNRMAGESVLPERRELMTPESASRYIAELMASPAKRGAIKEGYAKLDLRRGAAERVADVVLKYFK